MEAAIARASAEHDADLKAAGRDKGRIASANHKYMSARASALAAKNACIAAVPK